MTKNLSRVKARLDPLIRRLSSNFDGEKLAAVDAIQRVLKKEGLDLNDLAGMLKPAEDDPLDAFIQWAGADALATLALRKRRISERTKMALARLKRFGVQLGNPNLAKANKLAAKRRAKKIWPVMQDLAGMSARAAAKEMNRRKVPTPTGAPWSYKTVQRVRRRLNMSP